MTSRKNSCRFGPTVGGDGVVAFHPDVAAEEPPTSGAAKGWDTIPAWGKINPFSVFLKGRAASLGVFFCQRADFFK